MANVRENWNDEQLMRKVYKDIRRVRNILLASVAESGFVAFHIGIDKDYSPIGHCDMSSGDLFFTMDQQYEGYSVSNLYTPFGGLLLLNGGLCSELVRVSDIFMKKLKYEYGSERIEDVTDTQLMYPVFDDDEKVQALHFSKFVHPDTKLFRLRVLDGMSENTGLLFRRGCDREWEDADDAFKKASRGKDFC